MNVYTSRQPAERHTKHFNTTCVNSASIYITEMVGQSREITRETFLGHVDLAEMDDLERSLGYAVGHEKGLHMTNDYMVSYYKSQYRGQPCVYFDWSSIEHVFTE